MIKALITSLAFYYFLLAKFKLMEHDDTQKENNTSSTMKNNLAVPMAIVIAGALIAGAIYWSARRDSVATAPQPQAVAENTGGLEKLASITSTDHIRGNPNAPVKIVEYSDMECPFCKRFHSTMQQAMDEYGKDGRVAWVYRHFPLDSIHSKARTEAVASECAGEFGGSDEFWKAGIGFKKRRCARDDHRRPAWGVLRRPDTGGTGRRHPPP